MDKKQALKVLIEHSFLLTVEMKSDLLAKLPNFAEAEIESIGKFLALEKKLSLQRAEDNLEDIHNTLHGPDIINYYSE